MAEHHEIISDIIADRASSTTDLVRNLNTGLVFYAEIDGSPDALIVATELGTDYRNVVLLHVTSDKEASQINETDIVTFKLFGRNARAQILKRRDSAANPQSDFWAQQLTPKDAA